MRGKIGNFLADSPLHCCHLKGWSWVENFVQQSGDNGSLSLVSSLGQLAKINHDISYIRLHACITFLFSHLFKFLLAFKHKNLDLTLKFPFLFFVFLSSKFSTIDQMFSFFFSFDAVDNLLGHFFEFTIGNSDVDPRGHKSKDNHKHPDINTPCGDTC